MSKGEVSPSYVISASSASLNCVLRQVIHYLNYALSAPTHNHVFHWECYLDLSVQFSVSASMVAHVSSIELFWKGQQLCLACVCLCKSAAVTACHTLKQKAVSVDAPDHPFSRHLSYALLSAVNTFCRIKYLHRSDVVDAFTRGRRLRRWAMLSGSEALLGGLPGLSCDLHIHS